MAIRLAGHRMRIKELISALGASALGYKDAEVRAVVCDTRQIAGAGDCVFVALGGEHVDGHDYIAKATALGAVCVITERPAPEADVPQLIVTDARVALSKVADLLNGSPSKRMTLVGVTGTNGKTTITYILESIFREAGYNTGVIGTVNYRYGGQIYAAPHTTPQAPQLQGILRSMADAGVTHCAMEVSSHALEQMRVADCAFKAGIFTNLTHEHLDYHGTMEEYYEAKAMLFKRLLRDTGGVSVINIDDAWGRKLAMETPGALTSSLEKGAFIFPLEYELGPSGIRAVIATTAGPVTVTSPLVGEYNLQNILGAAGAAAALGIAPEAISRGVAKLSRVPGRLDRLDVSERGFTAYVDYAHTGDALERALCAIRGISAGRLITVFGCGGNRDRLKRPKMGEVSARLSDVTIVTSDNPRDEDPLEIIAEVEAGIKGVRRLDNAAQPEGKAYMVIPDRAAAIRKAVAIAGMGDTIIVAGKGHEDYQIVKGAKTPFDDMKELRAAVKDIYGCSSGL